MASEISGEVSSPPATSSSSPPAPATPSPSSVLADNVVCSWGHGDAEDRLLPTLLSALDGRGVTSVVCGADHTTAWSASELQVYSWGCGDFGRLGHGNSSDVFTPQPVKALQGIKIKQIASGDSHCLAVTMDGEVHSWGRNQNGQLGLGTTEDALVPQKIEAFQDDRQMDKNRPMQGPAFGYPQ